jgi:hypothetical protein
MMMGRADTGRFMLSMPFQVVDRSQLATPMPEAAALLPGITIESISVLRGCRESGTRLPENRRNESVGKLPASNRDDRARHRRDQAAGDASDKELSQSGSAVGSDDEEVSTFRPSRAGDLLGGVAFQKETHSSNACLLGFLCQSPELLLTPPPRLTVNLLPCRRVEVLLGKDRHERHDDVQDGQRRSIGPRHCQSGRESLTGRLREI